MKSNFCKVGPSVAFILACALFVAGCSQPTATGYRIYSLPDQGIAHLSFEYPASFNVSQVQLFDDTGYERMDIVGPYSRQNYNRTTMWVVAQRFPESVTVGALVETALGVAEGLAGYRLIDRSTTGFNGITAEQIIYFYYAQRTDYEKNVLGLSPVPTVTRQLHFSAEGLQWTVAMSADENTVDADTPGFEYLLQTLTMLP